MTNKTRLFDNFNKLEGDTFYPKQPCVIPDQPVRHEERRQRVNIVPNVEKYIKV